MDKDEYLAEFARQERERIERLKAEYSQYWKSIAQERWKEEERQPQEKEGQKKQNHKKDREQTYQRNVQQRKQSERGKHFAGKGQTNRDKQQYITKKTLAKQEKQKAKARQVQKQQSERAYQARQDRWTPKDWLDPFQAEVLKALVESKIPQVGLEICVTLENLCKKIKSRRKDAEHISKPTLIKTIDELCRMNFISKQVYVFSKGRGTIRKIATYVLLPKAVVFLTGLFGKFGEKVKRVCGKVWDRLMDKWLKEKSEELDRIGKVGVNIKNWLVKQGFKLLKCTHPVVFYLIGDG